MKIPFFQWNKDPPVILYTAEPQINEDSPDKRYVHTEISSWKEKVRLRQKDNHNIQQIIHQLQNPDSIESKRYMIKDGLLYRKDNRTPFGSRLVIDPMILREIFKQEHESALGGHFATEKTYLNIARRFWCKYLYEEVKKLCNDCVTCSIAKPSNVIYVDPAAKPIPKEIFERFELDVQSPITINNSKKYILLIVDVLSHYVYAES